MQRKKRRIFAAVIAIILALALILPLVLSVSAGEVGQGTHTAVFYDSSMVHAGITLDGMSLNGKTVDEVRRYAEDTINQRKSAIITLEGALDGQSVQVSAGNLGLRWNNPEVISQIEQFGHGPNIIARYKESKDIQEHGANFFILTSFNKSMIRTFIEMNCTAFDIAKQEPTLRKTNGVFEAEDGVTGYKVDIDSSATQIYDFLTNEWDGTSATLQLDVDISEPSATAAELEGNLSIIGSYTTMYPYSDEQRCKNIENGCRLINGSTISPGEEYSVLDAITPFTEENGYYLAGSYAGDEVVESFGGGICQVSTTLYNAIIRAELEVTARSNHSMIVTYVQPSEDAAIAESTGMDLKFVNTLDYPVYLEGLINGKSITFNVYSIETRSPNRRVGFESETLETIPSEGISVRTDPLEEIGVVKVTEGHTGYKAQLWKVITTNGVQQEKELFNTSEYQMTPKIVSVGSCGTVTAEMKEAMESEDVEQIKAAAAKARNELTPEEREANAQKALEAKAAANRAYSSDLSRGTP